MVHRRLLYDDARGVGEPLNETQARVLGRGARAGIWRACGDVARVQGRGARAGIRRCGAGRPAATGRAGGEGGPAGLEVIRVPDPKAGRAGLEPRGGQAGRAGGEGRPAATGRASGEGGPAAPGRSGGEGRRAATAS